MQEKIGKVTLDYEFYPGEDLYSDGACRRGTPGNCPQLWGRRIKSCNCRKKQLAGTLPFFPYPSEYTGVASNPENRQGSGNWLWMRSVLQELWQRKPEA